MNATIDTIVHESPAWRERANFVIVAKIDPGRMDTQWRWEQLWAEQLSESRFILCCIPFFVYDLALGDEVEAGSLGSKQYVVQRVVMPSVHYTFRAWFHDLSASEKMIRGLASLGCLMEQRWPSSSLLAIDVVGSQAQEVADFLWRAEQAGQLTYETGFTKAR